MAKVDWSARDQNQAQISDPGMYRVKVVACEERESKSGDPYFSVRLAAVDFDNAFIGFDTIMLEGGGISIGIAKLTGLGITEQDGDDLQPEQLVDREAWAMLEIDTYQGRTRMQVDIRADESECGYYPISGEEPKGVQKPVADGEAAPAKEEDAAPF